MEPNLNPNQEPFGLEEERAPEADLSPTENDRLLAGLSYLSQILIPAVFPVILLLTEDTKKRRFLRFHSIQSLGLLVATIIYYLAAVVVQAVIGAVLPFLLCLTWVLFLVPAGALCYYAYQSFTGKYAEVPWLTDFMRGNGWL